jgi:hypothetical protein
MQTTEFDDNRFDEADFDKNGDHIPTLRWAADMLWLWALCGKPACRRARACRRDPRQCNDRYAPLVPQAAGCGFIALTEARLAGRSADDARAEAPEDIAAYEDWLDRVARSVQPRRDQRRPSSARALA